MGKIIVSENVTLDGVTQDPAGDEGFRRTVGDALAYLTYEFAQEAERVSDRARNSRLSS
jgi:hypothetical protein